VLNLHAGIVEGTQVVQTSLSNLVLPPALNQATITTNHTNAPRIARSSYEPPKELELELVEGHFMLFIQN